MAASEDDLFCGECGAVLSASTAQPVDVPPADFQAQPRVAPVPSEPTYYAPAGPEPTAFPSGRRDSRAKTAYVLGIVSLALAPLSCVPFFGFFYCLEPIVGVIAIILGSIVKRDIDARGGSLEDRKKAHQGMVMGIGGTVLFFVLMIVYVILGFGLGVLPEL
jgi:hypothetical protein